MGGTGDPLLCREHSMVEMIGSPRPNSRASRSLRGYHGWYPRSLEEIFRSADPRAIRLETATQGISTPQTTSKLDPGYRIQERPFMSSLTGLRVFALPRRDTPDTNGRKNILVRFLLVSMNWSVTRRFRESTTHKTYLWWRVLINVVML